MSSVLRFFDSLSGDVVNFKPHDEKNVRFYACGPTVYDRIHIGNARSAVVFDVLYRLLRFIYGEDCVTYVRNITDVDDKIINRAKELGVAESDLTRTMIDHFQSDLKYLNCLEPNFQPRVTECIDDIIRLIQKIINNGHAYIKDGNVLFDVESFDEYGALSKRNVKESVAGSRVVVDGCKKNDLDFLLWKKTSEGITWKSPWGDGRPGWHIECSAMSAKFLGESFDIHGGGVDIKFPHHENEIAQSKCACKGCGFAKYWVHNGMLNVNGQKMSKSLGNFVTIADIIEKGFDGLVLRWALLSAVYSKPLNFSEQLLRNCEMELKKFHSLINGYDDLQNGLTFDEKLEIAKPLLDDLNTRTFGASLHRYCKEKNIKALHFGCKLIGLI